MKKIIIFLVFYLILIANNTIFAQKQSFEKKFKTQYHNAKKYIENNQNTIKKNLQSTEIDWKIAISVVFPEIVRFSEIQNFLEVRALELLYTNNGSKYANFSIGRFQMKPSFIETLESQLKKYDYPLLQTFDYKNKKEKEERYERIKRLSNDNWQFRYLKAFCWIVKKRFPNKVFNNSSEQIRFYASAYNLGFLQSEANIIKWQSKQFFPSGAAEKSSKQYSYSQISVDFYEKHLKNL
jgi:hypothetical protein